MTKLLPALLLLLMLAGGLLALNPGVGVRPLGPSISGPQAVLLGRITELAELVTLRAPVSTVITTGLAGYTGSVSCVIVVNGEVELGVDLAQARFEDVNPEARTATLILPEPAVRAARLDHACTKVHTVDRDGLWHLVLSDEPGRRVINAAMEEAQAAVAAAADSPRLHAQAREQAERVLAGVFEAVGWETRPKWAQ